MARSEARLRAAVASLALWACVAGCGEPALTLYVDVRTDYVPGLQFATVRTEVAVPRLEPGVEPHDTQMRPAARPDDFLHGLRVAEIDGLSAGRLTVRVTLLDGAGREVAVRTTRLELTESFALTVMITTSCDGVTCPRSGDPPGHTTCLGGRCVDPRCRPGAGERCGDAGCRESADCPDAPACGDRRCIDHECFVSVDDAACGVSGMVCHPIDGCVSVVDTDAGPPCSAAETRCMDGVDDDCDGLTDCGDPDCAPLCADCRSDVDCGPPTPGEWGACGGFVEPCGEAGTRSRAVATPRCVSGGCTVEMMDESEPCARVTEGTSCGAPTVGVFGSCGGFSGPCAVSGRQTRTVTDHACIAGSCRDQTRDDSQPCARPAPADGTMCGATSWEMCCGGACTDTRSDASHCGACGVDCAAVSLGCAATGNGGYSCASCRSNAQCRTADGPSATCWDVASPPAFCQCQCPSNGVCADAGCGPGMFCHDCAGHNWCAPFGGAC